MAPQALKCFKEWIIKGYRKELENPIESNLISATTYSVTTPILSDLVLALCNEWMWISNLAAVKTLSMIEKGGVSVKGRSQFVLQCPVILQAQIKSSFEMPEPKAFALAYCCPCWKQKHLVIMP